MARTGQRPSNEGTALRERSSHSSAKPGRANSVMSPSSQSEPVIMSLDEAAAAYEGEWALMRVTRHDVQTGELYGEILLHHPSRKEISKAAKRAAKLEPNVHLAFILGGTQRRSWEESLALMEKAARGPYVNAHW
jgi:hypothetical protein